jgi:hypothetical protein
MAKFRTTVLTTGKTTMGIEVPDEIVEELGSSKRPAVVVTINGYSYRTSIARMGGRFMFGVSADHRVGAGVAGGDDVDVELELDTAPRTVTVPPDLAEALGRDEKAKAFFDGLSYSNQSWYVSRVESAKKPETRQRRVEESIVMLRDGRTAKSPK